MSEQEASCSAGVSFVVLGKPLGWERATPRVVELADGRKFNKPFTPKQTRNAQAHIKLVAQGAMRGRALFDEPLDLILTAIYPIPVSFSKKKRADALRHVVRPAVKPDLDNVEKLALDAMTGIVFRDDVLICGCTKVKIYGERPRLVVTVRPCQRAAVSGGGVLL